MKSVVRELLLLFAIVATAHGQVPFLRPGVGMSAANQAAGELMRAWLAHTAPEQLATLEAIQPDEVIVVRESMDHIQDVLGAARIPFRLVEPHGLDPSRLDPARQMVMINCPGQNIAPEKEAELPAFVRAGGWLMTTDWALTVLAKQFPGYVKPSGGSTGDEIVSVQLQDPLHPLLHGVMAEDAAARWWLEGGSYPIQILKPDQVRVLVHSPEMKQRYGHEAVAVHFEYGLGTVFHLTSHMYLQRGDRERVQETAESYVRNCLIGKEVDAVAVEAVIPKLGAISRGEMESAYTITKFVARIVIENRSRE